MAQEDPKGPTVWLHKDSGRYLLLKDGELEASSTGQRGEVKISDLLEDLKPISCQAEMIIKELGLPSLTEVWQAESNFRCRTQTHPFFTHFPSKRERSVPQRKCIHTTLFLRQSLDPDTDLHGPLRSSHELSLE